MKDVTFKVGDRVIICGGIFVAEGVVVGVSNRAVRVKQKSLFGYTQWYDKSDVDKIIDYLNNK